MEEKWEWPAIGIDLGTRNSSVAICQHGHVEIIVNDQGNRKTPSCVAFTQKECLIGNAAKNQMARNPANTIFDVKKLIGRRFSDATARNDFKSWPFKVIADAKNDKPTIVVSYKGEKKQFTAEEISSMVIMKMKETAEAYLHTKVKHAVITVPAYFNDSQRQATKDAGVMAGLSTIRIISEPTAALIAYDFHKQPYSCLDANVLIFDMQGGTLDVSLLTINKDIVEFKSVSGHSQLGGDDFDKILACNFAESFTMTYGHGDFDENDKELVASCEMAKRILSTSSETVCHHKGFSLYINRAKFELLSQDLFEECMQHVEQCLRNAKMGRSDIDHVVLVGASTRIPKVQQILQQLFEWKKFYNTFNAEEAVAYGAAIHAAMLSGVYKFPTFPRSEFHLGASVEESFLVPCKRFRREVQTKAPDSSLLFILQDIDLLLENLPDSKVSRNSSTFFLSKARLMKLLEEIRLKPNDLQLTRKASQLLKGLYPFLPEHLLTVVKSLEEDLLASQHQFMDWASKEAAIPLKQEESGTIQSRLVKIKTQIQEKTSSRNGLISKIAGIDKEIAKLMDYKSQLNQDLSSAEQDLYRLIRSIEPQLDFVRKQSAQLSQLREANNFKAKAMISIEATLDSLANYFRHL